MTSSTNDGIRTLGKRLHSVLASCVMYTYVMVSGCSLSIDVGTAPSERSCTSSEDCTEGLECREGECARTLTECDLLAGDDWVEQCAPCEPSDELCDALDNDCDGEVDEEAAQVGDICTLDGATQDSLVGDQGIYACVSGALECLPDGPVTPMEEVCDLEDNDGDGVVDEGLDDTGVEIQCPPGSCRMAAPVRCEEGDLINDCNRPAHSDDVEDTCNGYNDDCDEFIDEDAPETVSCGAICGVSASSSCEQGMLIDQCEAELSGVMEICDGDDNDCDDVVDEGLDWVATGIPCGDGICSAESSFVGCEEGEEVERCTDDPSVPLAEDPLNPALHASVIDLCDGLDNNCNGVVDEDSTHDLDACFDPQASGLQTRSIRCVEGQRVASPCGAGEAICTDTGVPLSETMCLCADTDAPDLASIDDNCDGLDGWVSRGIFVHPTLGDDQNQGGPQDPLRTLGAALELSRGSTLEHPEETPPEVYLSVGDYLITPYEVVHDLSITGGYEAEMINGAIQWSRPAANNRVEENPVHTVITGEESGPVFRVNTPGVDLSLQTLTLRPQDGTNTLSEGERSSIGIALLSCDVTQLVDVEVIGGQGAPGRPGSSASPIVFPRERLQGVSAASNEGGAGGENSECCPAGECRGGRGGDYEGNGAFGLPASSNNQGFGLGGVHITLRDGFVTLPTAGLNGQQGADATPESLLGAMDITTGSWISTNDGSPASPGEVGSGGGGGAGFSEFALSQLDRVSPDTGGGGGGGAGGCGGAPGDSGESGGWSIGIVIGRACAVFYNQVRIVRGFGGAGGRAGVGGSGELGGAPGSSHPEDQTYRGARGGQGGCGGHGVGGNGGSSVGVVYLYNHATFIESYLMSGGREGAGGSVPTNSACERVSGAEGQPGLVATYICCPQNSEGLSIAECGLCPRP